MVHEVSGVDIPWGKRMVLKCVVPHGIHGGDPADDTEGIQGPQYLPQDHMAPGYLGDWVVFRPLFKYHSGDLISAKKNNQGNEETKARTFNSKFVNGKIW